ncbi:hypothetical protein CK203_030096 [Vitis vinifera]|uniref:Uncharacterized protein n=1 Tax=Vitis vinifera TaxID=29760 RepID=A0A438I5E2_VITVI|nr:hypothetical protein CK203_030096 [Vitis vinifera]
MERKTLKVLVERKTFLIRLEGEQGGKWCSMTEISRGSVFALGPSDGSWLQQPWKVHKDLGVCYQQKIFCSDHSPRATRAEVGRILKKALSSMLVVPYPNAVEKGRNIRGESWPHNNVGSMHRSYAKAIIDEGPKGGGLVLVGRWARAVVCESKFDRENWAEVGRSVARSLGKKGVVMIVPILAGNGVFSLKQLRKLYFSMI